MPNFVLMYDARGDYHLYKRVYETATGAPHGWEKIAKADQLFELLNLLSEHFKNKHP